MRLPSDPGCVTYISGSVYHSEDSQAKRMWVDEISAQPVATRVQQMWAIILKTRWGFCVIVHSRPVGPLGNNRSIRWSKHNTGYFNDLDKHHSPQVSLIWNGPQTLKHMSDFLRDSNLTLPTFIYLKRRVCISGFYWQYLKRLAFLVSR